MVKFYWENGLSVELSFLLLCLLKLIGKLVILIILWLLGFVTSYTMGGFIHGLLVIAIVVILIRVIQGRRV